MNPRDLIERLFVYAPDEPPAGTDPGTPPADSGTDPPKELTAAEKQAAEHQREVDRYRNEAGQAAKKARDLEKRLQEIEDAGKTETERLQAQAKVAEQVPELEARIESLAAVLTAEVERQKAALKDLDKDMLDLLPDGPPEQQLAWVSKALAKANKDAGDRKKTLPPGGGRAPVNGAKEEPSDAERAAHAQHLAARF
jgi:hypothetical protein